MLRERFAALFEGEYATGIAPDEVNWRQGRDPEDRTRQICNGWRADDLIAAQVLSEHTGRVAAKLMGYRGTRMVQDNCLWKPPGAQVARHAPGRLLRRLPLPPEMITCWVALDDTLAQGGTIELVRGRTYGRRRRPIAGASTRPTTGSRRSRRRRPRGSETSGSVVVKAGGCEFHHSLTFHGSGPQRVRRRAAGARLAPRAGRARFHPEDVDLIYSRYRRSGDLSLDESFFPVLWDENGGRTAWLEGLPTFST